MKPEIASTLTEYCLVTVVDLLVTHPARVNGRSVRILRVENLKMFIELKIFIRVRRALHALPPNYHGLIRRIHLPGAHRHRLRVHAAHRIHHEVVVQGWTFTKNYNEV